MIIWGNEAAFGKARADCSCDVEAPSRLRHSPQPRTPTARQRCDRILTSRLAPELFVAGESQHAPLDVFQERIH